MPCPAKKKRATSASDNSDANSFKASSIPRKVALVINLQRKPSAPNLLAKSVASLPGFFNAASGYRALPTHRAFLIMFYCNVFGPWQQTGQILSIYRRYLIGLGSPLGYCPANETDRPTRLSVNHHFFMLIGTPKLVTDPFSDRKKSRFEFRVFAGTKTGEEFLR